MLGPRPSCVIHLLSSRSDILRFCFSGSKTSAMFTTTLVDTSPAAKPNHLARELLRERAEARCTHDREHRVSTGRRVVWTEDDRRALGGDLDRSAAHRHRRREVEPE